MGTKKFLTISERMERIHANASVALSNMPDRHEFCEFYTACMTDAELQDDETYKVTFLFYAEGHKDMGTVDPFDDQYISLHDISSHYEYSVEDFKAAIQALIEMYGEKEIEPFISDEYLELYGLPEDYTIEHLYEVIDNVIANSDWHIGGSFGVYIVGYIDIVNSHNLLGSG